MKTILFLSSLLLLVSAQEITLDFFEVLGNETHSTFDQSNGVGNVTWFRNDIFSDISMTSVLGFSEGWCTLTSQVTSECEWTIQFTGANTNVTGEVDSLYLKGTLLLSRPNNTFAILGGTGQYSVSRGEAIVSAEEPGMLHHTYTIINPPVSNLRIIEIQVVEMEASKTFEPSNPVNLNLFRSPVFNGTENQSGSQNSTFAGQSIGYCWEPFSAIGEPYTDYLCGYTIWVGEGWITVKALFQTNQTQGVGAVVGAISANGSWLDVGGEFRWSVTAPLTFPYNLTLFVRDGDFSALTPLLRPRVSSPAANSSSALNVTQISLQFDRNSATRLIPEDGNIFFGMRELFFSTLSPTGNFPNLVAASGEFYATWGKYLSMTLLFPDGSLVTEGVWDGEELVFPIIGGTGTYRYGRINEIGMEFNR